MRQLLSAKITLARASNVPEIQTVSDPLSVRIKNASKSNVSLIPIVKLENFVAPTNAKIFEIFLIDENFLKMLIFESYFRLGPFDSAVLFLRRYLL